MVYKYIQLLVKQMKNLFKDEQIQKRFDPFMDKLKKTTKQMPPLEEIHDPNKPGSTDVVPYDLKAYAFFEEYKKDLDVDRTLKTLNIPKKVYTQWLDQPKFTDVLNRIHQAYEDAVLMDAKTVAGWSVEILRDIHNRFKEGDSKAGSALAAMAGNMLRASGNFKDATQTAPQVLIQIDTGNATAKSNDTQNTEPKVINATPQESTNKSDHSININIKSKENDKQRIANMSILCGE